MFSLMESHRILGVGLVSTLKEVGKAGYNFGMLEWGCLVHVALKFG